MGPYRGNRVQVATGACLTLAPLRGALGGQGQAPGGHGPAAPAGYGPESKLSHLTALSPDPSMASCLKIYESIYDRDKYYGYTYGWL